MKRWFVLLIVYLIVTVYGKIFVYNLPKKFNLAVLEQNQKLLDTYPQKFSMGREEWNCLNNIFRTEITFHQRIIESEFITQNPEEATFFYVPIYTVCRMNLNLPFDLQSSVSKSVTFHTELLEHIKQSYPYWNKSQGRDHMFLVSQGFGAKLLGPDIYQHAIVLTVNSDLEDEAYNPQKDISIPPDMLADSPPFVPYEFRRYQAFFGGSIGLWKNPNYSKDWLVFERHGVLNEDMRQFYYHIMSNSVYCLAPEGIFAFTPRISESILSGCVPVIISDSFEPPFSSELDYSKFSVRVSLQDLPHLERILRGIPEEEARKKLEAVRTVAGMFKYNSPPKEGDAIYRIMTQLQSKHEARKV